VAKNVFKIPDRTLYGNRPSSLNITGRPRIQAQKKPAGRKTCRLGAKRKSAQRLSKLNRSMRSPIAGEFNGTYGLSLVATGLG
jgi:hypothetical protein